MIYCVCILSAKENMKKVYFVDSENIGDLWVRILSVSEKDDQILIFYTQKSPHMHYENLRFLLEQDKLSKVTFIKCYEGQNALDFQLVTELGYRLRDVQDSEFIIVTNDNGYDAVVKYWSDRKMPVNRLNGRECLRRLQAVSSKPSKNETPLESADEQSKAETGQTEALVTEHCDSAAHEHDTLEPEKKNQKNTASRSRRKEQQTSDPEPQNKHEDAPAPELTPERREEETVRDLLLCIGRDNMADLHNVLVMLMGEEDGKELYLRAKSNPGYVPSPEEVSGVNQKEKFQKYCRLVFLHSELAAEQPEDFDTFLCGAKDKRKNLNSLRAALQGRYGKDKGMRYYSLFKSHIKIINRM